MAEEAKEQSLTERVEAALDRVRGALAADGGGIELVEVTDEGVAKVRLQGACAGCPGAVMTLRDGVERVLKEAVPSVKEVVAV